ncbi:hypothetical protein V8F20_002903 [Naviculisporaceae sp. PSN 640]
MASLLALRLSTLLISQALILLFTALPAHAFSIVNCTENSFRTPAFAVDELNYSSPLHTGSFRVTNIAINYTTVINCKDGRCALDSRGNGDDKVDTFGALALEGQSVSISLNQSWSCSDKRWNDTVPVRLNFTANATAFLPVECASAGACTATKRLSLIKASLISPMAGTPRWLEPLSGQRVAKCRPPAEGTGLWEVRNVKWFDRDRPCVAALVPGPAPAYCPPNGVGLEAQVSNRVLNMTTSCTGMMRNSYSSDGTMYAIDCEPLVAKPRRYTTRTSAIVLREGDGSLATVQVNQTWQCDDEGADRPVEVQVRSAPVTIPISCTYDNGTINFSPFFGPATTYSWRETTCIGNTSSTLPVASSTTTYIPPYSLEEPWDDYYAGTCLLRHLRTTGWATDLVAKRLDFSKGQPKVAEISFFADSRYLHAGGPDNSVPVPLRPGANETDGTVWVDCYSPGEKTDYPCRFKFDSATGAFTLKRLTQCNDIDRAHPYLITTTASFVYPPMDCTWNDYYPESEKGVITRCMWQADPRVTNMMRVKSLSDIVWGPMPAGFSPTLWDGRPASAFPWLEPAR